MKCFLTGTDTDVGKTVVSAGLLARARLDGLSCIGLKPVAAGAESGPDGDYSDDALRLAQGAGYRGPLAAINPVLLAPPIAPHVAAADAGITLEALALANWVRDQAADYQAVIVEGAGGWRVPINAGEGFDSIAKHLGWPVILVVGMRLGCINHALLTVEAIAADGLCLAGWVANRVDPGQLAYADNLAALKARIRAPLLGVVEWSDNPAPDAVAAQVRWPD
ncbi:dethiobiotin synthase [Litorivicinus lipolyticus]|uniref:dethiobiotin synthase n=1 Tax=Litorivicinus lipolyticus TaxID=418701 RepID=UPI003B5C2B85